MTIKNLLAVALATASTASLALGAANTLITGNPGAFLIGTAAFIALAFIATSINPTI